MLLSILHLVGLSLFRQHLRIRQRCGRKLFGHLNRIEYISAVAEDLVDLFEMSAIGFWEEEVDSYMRVSLALIAHLGPHYLQGTMRNQLIQAYTM